MESVAALLFSKCRFGISLPAHEQESRSFTLINTFDSGLTNTEDSKPAEESGQPRQPSEVQDESEVTEIETLRMK